MKIVRKTCTYQHKIVGKTCTCQHKIVGKTCTCQHAIVRIISLPLYMLMFLSEEAGDIPLIGHDAEEILRHME